MKKLGFGLMRLPLSNYEDKGSIDMEQTCKMIDAYIERGFTYFDTAYPYHDGKSEEAFREAVAKRYPRDRYTITDKMPMFNRPSKEQMEAIFNEQLKRCGVEYFDYYLLHALNRDTFAFSEKVIM